LGWAEGNFAPLRRPINNGKEVQDLESFKCRACYAGFVEQGRDVGQSGEVEISTRAVEFANVGGEVLLAFDPDEIKRGSKLRDLCPSKVGARITAQKLPQSAEFQHSGARILHSRRHDSMLL